MEILQITSDGINDLYMWIVGGAATIFFILTGRESRILRGKIKDTEQSFSKILKKMQEDTEEYRDKMKDKQQLQDEKIENIRHANKLLELKFDSAIEKLLNSFEEVRKEMNYEVKIAGEEKKRFEEVQRQNHKESLRNYQELKKIVSGAMKKINDLYVDNPDLKQSRQ